MNSKQKLAQALEESKAPTDFIQRAREGYYSDYDSPLTTPCIQLVMDLTKHGFLDLAKMARNGDFDATKEESDAWWEREGKAIADEVGLPRSFGERKQ